MANLLLTLHILMCQTHNTWLPSTKLHSWCILPLLARQPLSNLSCLSGTSNRYKLFLRGSNCCCSWQGQAHKHHLCAFCGRSVVMCLSREGHCQLHICLSFSQHVASEHEAAFMVQFALACAVTTFKPVWNAMGTGSVWDTLVAEISRGFPGRCDGKLAWGICCIPFAFVLSREL